MYSDVPQTHWAYNNIMLAKYLGIMKGYPDGTFLPDAPVSRAEEATVAMRVLGIGVLFSSVTLAGYAYYRDHKKK